MQKNNNSEVIYSYDDITIINNEKIDKLKAISKNNTRKRVRLCAHPDVTDSLHQMIIVHEKDTYVRPHKHIGKSESIHIIEGKVDVVVFDELGQILKVIQMGDYESNKPFIHRMQIPTYHTLIIRSEYLIFHEITNGPFDRINTQFASWSPKETEFELIKNYLKKLENKIKKWVK
jgi:cupin fold WbuC family metalloprotein